MPRLSEKKRLERDLWDLFVFSAFDQGLNDESENWLILHEAVRESRYLSSRKHVARSNPRDVVLPSLDDDEFRSFARMDRPSFKHLAGLIRDDPIFQNNSNSMQAPVEAQLLYALYRFGHEGDANSYTKASKLCGVSEGHIYDCTKRVVTALCRIRDRFVKWPDAQERSEESFTNAAREGFTGAVGKVDGTDVVLASKPRGQFDREIYCHRKKVYAINLTAVCNARKEFTYMIAGWAGSPHDAHVFASTKLSKSPLEYFSPGQYLLGDSAYKHTEYLVPRYKAPDTNERINRKFNKKLSRVRIDIEHAFGMLKGRWKSLTGLRVRVNKPERYKYAVQWITACVVLHNILLRSDDGWDEDEGWWTPEEAEEGEEEEGGGGEEDDEDVEDEDEEDGKKAEVEPDEENPAVERQQLPAGLRKREYIKTIVLGTH